MTIPGGASKASLTHRVMIVIKDPMRHIEIRLRFAQLQNSGRSPSTHAFRVNSELTAS